MTLLELLQLLKKHLVLVVTLPIVCAIAMGVVAYGFMPNTYTAQTSLYVLADSNDSDLNLQSSLSTSQMIANDVSKLIKSSRVTGDAAKQLGLENLKDFTLSVTSETTSRVINVSVEGTDPKACADVANALAESVSDVAREVMNVQSVNVVDAAKTPAAPSGPKRTMYVAVAFLAGLFVAVAIIVLIDMLNTRVRTAEETEELLGVPVIGRFPALKGFK